MKVCYIAGAFRCASVAEPGQQDAWGIAQNIHRAAALGLEVWRLGAACIVPHLNTAPYQGAAPDRLWLAGDLAILERCDAILMLPDWRRSDGAQEEHRHATLHKIPVFYELDALATWLADARRADTWRAA